MTERFDLFFRWCWSPTCGWVCTHTCAHFCAIYVKISFSCKYNHMNWLCQRFDIPLFCLIKFFCLHQFYLFFLLLFLFSFGHMFLFVVTLVPPWPPISSSFQLPISTTSRDDKLLCLRDYLSITGWMKCEKQSEDRRAAGAQLQRMQLCQWRIIFWPFYPSGCWNGDTAFCFPAFHGAVTAGDLAVRSCSTQPFERQLDFPWCSFPPPVVVVSVRSLLRTPINERRTTLSAIWLLCFSSAKTATETK